MTAISGGNLTTMRGSGTHATATFLTAVEPRVIMTARINFPAGTGVAFPLGQLHVAFAAFPGGGALADVKPGMEIWIGSNSGNNDVWVGRVREAVSNVLIKVSEVGSGEHSIPQTVYKEIESIGEDNHYVTVVETMAVNYALPLISGGAIFKDWDEAYTDQNETAGIPPMANITFEDATRPVGFVDTGTSDYRFKVTMDNSYEGLTGNAVASQLWALASNMTLVGGYNLTDATIEVDATIGGGWLECTATASNAETHLARVPTHYYNLTSERPLQIFAVESDNEDRRGRTVSVNAYAQEIPLDEVPHGALCYFWSVDTFGGAQVAASRDVMLCWAMRESLFFNERFPTTSLELATAGHLLNQSLATPQMVESNASPSNWQEVIANYCNVPGMVHYLFHWHLKTLAALLDVRAPLGGETWTLTNQTAFGGQDLGDTNIGRQFDGLASRLPGQWGTTSDGRFLFTHDGQYVMPPGIRGGSVATRITLEKEDIRGIQAGRNHKLNTSLARGSAYIWQGAATEMKPALSQAPDLTPAQSGGGRNDLDGMIVQSQSALNWLTGAHWAVSNQPWTFTITLDRMLDVFNPVEGDRVALTIPAASFTDSVFGTAWLRAFDLQNDPGASVTRNFYVESVMVERPPNTSQKVVRVTLFPELTPTPGVTIPILGPGEYPEYGALFANFSFPTPSVPSLSRTYRTPDARTIYALIYVPSTSTTHIVSSTNLINMNFDATWTDRGNIAATFGAADLVVDPNDPTTAYALVSVGGIANTATVGYCGDTMYRTTDLTSGSPTWTGKGFCAIDCYNPPAAEPYGGTVSMSAGNADWVAVNQFVRDTTGVNFTDTILHYMSTGDWGIGAATKKVVNNENMTWTYLAWKSYIGCVADLNGTGTMAMSMFNASSSSPDTYLVATSSDWGVNWSLTANTDGVGEFIYMPKTKPDGASNDSGDIILSASSDNGVPAGRGGEPGLWLSEDGGDTFTDIIPAPGRELKTRYNQQIAIAESDANKIAYPAAGINNFWLTKDLGENWKRVPFSPLVESPLCLGTYYDSFYGDMLLSGDVGDIDILFEWDVNKRIRRETSDIDTIVGTSTWYCEKLVVV